MTVNCPGCGKTFPQEDHAYYGHLSSCQKMRDLRASQKAKPAVVAAATEKGATGTPAAPVTAPVSGKTSFFYAKEAPIPLGPLEITKEPGTAAPGQPAQPTTPGVAPQPAAGDMLKEVFETFGIRWNAWLEAEPGQPTLEAAKWTEKDTELSVKTFNAIDKKYGVGTIAQWAPELLLVSLVINIAVKTYTGLRAKGKLRGGGKGLLGRGSSGPPGMGFSNPKEDKDAAQAWEAELAQRQGQGEPKT